jgi:hypothetical protein
LTYVISHEGINWSPLPLPAPGVHLFTSDGQLMAGALSDDSSVLTTWRFANGDWDVVDSGAFDRSACGDIDDRDGLYFFATQDKTLATVGQVNWRSIADGWSCLRGPHIAIAPGHGLFVGTGESDLDAPDASFWRSDDGLEWTKVQPVSNGPRAVAVGDGFARLPAVSGTIP